MRVPYCVTPVLRSPDRNRGECCCVRIRVQPSGVLWRTTCFGQSRMKRFLCGLLKLIAWGIIIWGAVILNSPASSKWQGLSLVAVGFSTFTVATFISGRIRIYSQDDQTLVTADDSPISFMLVLTILFLVSCTFMVAAVVDFVRHFRTG